MIEIIVFLGIFIALIIPMGKYLYHVTTGQKTFADKVFNPIDRFLYKLCGIKDKEMSWKKYAISLLITNLFMIIIGYLILRVQAFFLNPNGASNMESSLAFNTVISFMSNTNLQHYAGEVDVTYISQMIVIIFMMFTSAATGLSACMAFMRGISGKFKTMGNYFVDMIRIITRILLPLSLIVGLILVSQGVIQNFSADVTVKTIEGVYQNIAMGPAAALESIKHLGTNGGGFFLASSAHPFENPNVLTNMIEMLSMTLMPGSCVIAFGHMISKNDKKEKQAWLKNHATPIFAVMLVLFVGSILLIRFSEQAGNPLLNQLGVNAGLGNMVGKEMRFGVGQSSLFTSVTTAFTTGSINTMHDSLTPLGGMGAMFNMMLNLVFGGKGIGLMNMILYVILTVFICGLMVGRTPEFLSKKIEGREIKLTALAIIIHPLLILAGTALAVVIPYGFEQFSSGGYHGLSQGLYEFASSAANNGSGFEGLMDNTMFWNVSTAIVMFLGRYLMIVIALAIANSLMKKPAVNESIGTLRTNTVTFGVSLFMIVMIIAALTFLPVLVLGPISEHLLLWV